MRVAHLRAYCSSLVAIASTVAAARAADAQSPFYYPTPSAQSYSVARDVKYGAADTTTLRMDVYRPTADAAPRPALIIFFAGYGPTRASDFTASWARVAASKGLVTIVPDLRFGSQAIDFDILVPHLIANARQYGLDPNAIAVYAGSGNVFTALPVVEDPKRTSIKAAVMYYGDAPITEFRRDLPLLLVRAGLDRPSVNSSGPTGFNGIATLALSQNAPVTIINNAGGHHAFEIVDDDVITRDVIDHTVDFVKRAVAPEYQATIRRTFAEATAAAHVTSGNFAAAATAYETLVAQRPDDARLGLSYGEALLGAEQYTKACSAFAPLRGKGLGPRDLGLPAARACMLGGDRTAAIAWLQSIPKRFLPPAVKDEATFAPLKGVADFESLFRP